MTISALAQKAITVTDFIGGVATEAARVGGTAEQVATFISGVSFFGRIAAGFVPGLSSVMTVLDVAVPIIQKIAAAAPVVHAAIEQGVQVVAAAQDSGLLDSVKQLYAISVNADPARPETAMTAARVDDAVALDFVGNLFERSFFSPQDPRFANQSLG